MKINKIVIEEATPENARITMGFLFSIMYECDADKSHCIVGQEPTIISVLRETERIITELFSVH